MGSQIPCCGLSRDEYEWTEDAGCPTPHLSSRTPRLSSRTPRLSSRLSGRGEAPPIRIEALPKPTVTFKEPAPVVGYIISIFLNSFGLGQALLLSSIEHWVLSNPTDENIAFLSSVYQWKLSPGGRRFVEPVDLFILCLLPLVFLGQCSEAFQSFTRQAPAVMHVVDVLMPLTLFGVIIPTAISWVLPGENDVASCKGSAACMKIVSQLHQVHKFVALAQAAMLLMISVKFWSNAKLARMLQCPDVSTYQKEQ